MKNYQHDDRKQISIASTNWGGTTTRTSYRNGVKKVEKIPASKNYSITFVANPGFTITDLKKK